MKIEMVMRRPPLSDLDAAPRDRLLVYDVVWTMYSPGPCGEWFSGTGARLARGRRCLCALLKGRQ